MPVAQQLMADSSNTLALDEEWMASACLGGMLPESISNNLQRAALMYQRGEDAEPLLLETYNTANYHPAVHIALYRFYFYRHRIAEALQVAESCLLKVAADLHLPNDWRNVRPDQARFGTFDDVVPRFYLYTLKACAYLNMRSGNLALSGAMLQQLRLLDPKDRMGGSVLQDVLARIGVDDE